MRVENEPDAVANPRTRKTFSVVRLAEFAPEAALVNQKRPRLVPRRLCLADHRPAKRETLSLESARGERGLFLSENDGD
jgi:hypothetical protein